MPAIRLSNGPQLQPAGDASPRIGFNFLELPPEIQIQVIGTVQADQGPAATSAVMLTNHLLRGHVIGTLTLMRTHRFAAAAAALFRDALTSADLMVPCGSLLGQVPDKLRGHLVTAALGFTYEGIKATAIAGLGAYFSPSWTAFQADRGRDFSVIVDGVSV